jgi:hypothetical protein
MEIVLGKAISLVEVSGSNRKEKGLMALFYISNI